MCIRDRPGAAFGFGLGTIDQADPFHFSTRAAPPSLPTAVQTDAERQKTAVRKLLPDELRVGVGVMAQLDIGVVVALLGMVFASGPCA